MPRSNAPYPPPYPGHYPPGYWGGYYPYYPYYPYWGLGFGLGFYYDPFWYGSFWWPGYWDYPGGGYTYMGSGGSVYYTGEVKLKIKPKDAEVFVDGYYVGIVDDFDGMFQQLQLSADPEGRITHRIEVRAQGERTLSFEVRLQPGQTITYRGELRPGQEPDR